MLLTSLGVFAFAVLLLFALGPKSGPCHPPVSDKCIKTLLAFFTCFAHSIALLASIVFLVLFIVGANLHLLCRPLEDLEAAKGYVGAYSKVADNYLHSFLKSSLSNEGGSDRLPFFDNADIVSVVDRLSVKEIIRGCKKRETVFVILKLNTLKLPSKLAHMFENQMQTPTGKGFPGPDGPGKGRPTNHDGHLGGQQPSNWPRRPQEPSGGSTDRNEEGGMHHKQAGKGQIKFHGMLNPSQNGLLLNDETRFRRSLSHQCRNKFSELKNCVSGLSVSRPADCSENDYESYVSTVKSLQNISDKMAVICPDMQGRFINASMTQLSKGLLKYGEHLNSALEKDLLPCDVIIYSLGGLVNTVCWRFVRTINTWNFAVGLWCYLVIFTVCFSRTVRHMIGIKSKNSSEHDGSERDG
ncbi:hypothetical protein M513_03773 [Trichuris suis]|uniref:Uncharacterized protein n=1 Tax=Trichuris suis TaxID=68888 RepID=A0A085MDY7_9BILA|nr:hypothetical protein M513_03773 [Trichuris suis]